MRPPWRWLLFILLFGTIVLLTLPDHRNGDGKVLLVNDALDPMVQLLRPYAKDSLHLLNPYLQGIELSGLNGMAIVYGTQAAAYREQTGSSSYIPLYQASVVIAVNRIKNPGHVINGWKSMLSSNAVILIPHNGIEAGRLASVALAQALGAEEGNLEPALEAWAYLQSQNRLNHQNEYSSEEYRIMYQPDHLERYDAIVLWDYQAKMLQRIYDGWDVITPVEGTLSVDCGLLCGSLSQKLKTLIRTKNFLLSEEGRKQLQEAGFSPFECEVNLSPWNTARLTYNPSFRRSVLKVKLYSPASVLERTVLQSMVFLLFLVASQIILKRIPPGLYRNSSYYTLLFLLLWILFGILKTITFNETLTRYLWYATYIPRHAVPLGWYCMSCLNRSGRLPRKKLLILFGSIAVLLTLFVCTNDFHRQVFVFHGLNPADWDSQYTNNWGYYLSLLWSFSFSAAGVAILFRGNFSRRQKRLLHYAAAAFVLLLIYQILYIAGVRYVLDMDVPTTVSITILLFILSSQRERFMHTLLFSLPVFLNSPFAIAVYDKTGRSQFSNTVMMELMQKYPGISSLEQSQLDSIMTIPVGDRIYRTRIHKIENGSALVLEDITYIQSLEYELQLASKKLNAVKRLLTHQIQETRTLGGMIERERITKSMNGLFINKLSDLRGYLHKIREETGRAPASFLRHARFLLFICQHRLRFTIRSLESRSKFDVDLVAKYLSGLSKDLLSLGLDNTVTIGAHGSCSLGVLTMLLEAIDSIFLSAFVMQGISLILNLKTSNDGIELNAVLSWEDSSPLSDRILLPKNLVDKFTLSGVRVSLKNEEEGLFARLFFHYEEVCDDLV